MGVFGLIVRFLHLRQLTLKILNKNFKIFLVAGRLNDQDKIHADESSVNNSAGSSTDNK